VKLSTPHEIYINNELDVPVIHVADQCYAMQYLAKQVQTFLSKIDKKHHYDECVVYVSDISQKSPLNGSYKIYLEIRDSMSVFIGDIGELLNINYIKERKKALSDLILLFVLSGGFYAALTSFAAAEDSVNETHGAMQIEEKLKETIKETAQQTGIDENIIAKYTFHNFRSRGNKKLARNAVMYCSPAKHENNVTMTLLSSGIEIPPSILNEIPTVQELRKAQNTLTVKYFENVDVDIRGTDRDKRSEGWRAIVPCISEDRVKLVPPPVINLEEFSHLEHIKGDIYAYFTKRGNMNIPKVYHILNIRKDED